MDGKIYVSCLNFNILTNGSMKILHMAKEISNEMHLTQLLKLETPKREPDLKI